MIKITDASVQREEAELIAGAATKITTDAFKLIELKISFEQKWIKAVWVKHDSTNGVDTTETVTIPFRGARLRRVLKLNSNRGRNALRTLRTVLDRALAHYGDFPEIQVMLKDKIGEDASLPDELETYGDDLPSQE